MRTTLISFAILFSSVLAGAAPTPPQSGADAESYRAHLQTLASPTLEGRGPGLPGNRTAAEYLEHRFRDLGLKPAFVTGHRPGNEKESPSYFQQFNAGREVKVREAAFVFTPAGDGTDPAVERQTLVHGTDFSVLGNSGSAEVEGEIVFVGYSLEAGDAAGGLKPEDASYTESDDLTGKVALMFRFEPMNNTGKSRLTEKGEWSAASSISQKIMAAVKRNAAAIILVSPPSVDDRRAFTLETPESSAAWTRQLSIPSVMLTGAAAERLVKAADGRSLFDLRKVADRARQGLEADQSALLPFTRARVRISTATERLDRVTWNVGAVLPGEGDLASQYVVIGAHFDHVGRGYQGGSRSGEYGEIHPGADDNASGTSGLLVAAEMLVRRFDSSATTAGQLPSRRSILFLGFSAEEMGLIGSREFIKSPPIEAGSITAMLNMDMIGRVREDKLTVSGTGTAEGMADLLAPYFSSSGLSIESQPGGRGPSDHASFYGAGVPVLHFFSGLHPEYHTPRDTADLINVEDAVRVAELVARLAEALATRPEQLAFASTDRGARAVAARPDEEREPGPRTLRIRFGIAPANYAEGGDGVGVGDVFDGTSAAEAGIRVGDRLTRWNGEPIADVQEWMEYLRRHKPGDVVDVTLVRKLNTADPASPTEELVARVTLKARDQAPR